MGSRWLKGYADENLEIPEAMGEAESLSESKLREN